jgi:glycosyltransferase involved in cell wall biosynthesis
MRILILHQYFLGRGEGGGSRFNQFAKYWSKMGHDVTVVAGTVHYATGHKDARYRGKWLVREEDESGARVLRSYVSSGYNKGFRGRLWGYVSFALSATWAGLFAARKPTVILATSPPLTIAVPAYIISRVRRIPLVFEVRDLWPDFAVETGAMRNRHLIRFSYWLERFIYRKATLINVLTPGFELELRTEGVPPEKIVVVPNGADLDLFSPGERNNQVRTDYGWGDRFVILYTGAHGRANDLGQILEAAQQMLDRPEVLFILMGDGMEKGALQERARKLGLSNLQFIGTQPKQSVVDFVNAADVCIATLADLPGFRKVYPNKLFDYMACARPIIVGIDGVARELVADAEAGIFVEPNCPERIVAAVLTLLDDNDARLRYGERGYAFVQREFSRRNLAEKYAGILDGVSKE